MVKVGLASSDDQGQVVPSISGVLLASSDPTKWLPSAFIQAVAYRGESVVPINGALTYQLDAEDIKGPLDVQIARALTFVARNMRIAARKEFGRTDFPQYDLTAVLEVVVNAVAHRDYSIYGAKIRLQMFTNRLELFSPGSLANSMDTDSMKLRQSARNEVLTSLLARIPVPGHEYLHSLRSFLMDRRGEGVPVIFARSRACSGRDPEYRVLGDELQLTIFGASDD